MQPDWQQYLDHKHGKDYQWHSFAKGSSNTLYLGTFGHEDLVVRVNASAALTPGVDRAREAALVELITGNTWSPNIIENHHELGWCAMQLAEQISHVHDWHIPCLVDMGGDMAIGIPRDQTDNPIAWGIAVAKPHLANDEQFQDEEDVAILAINSGAIATSGQDYRRWWHEGSWQHHLIHPHSSRPVISDVLTATVIASDTMAAEVYAKYCVLLGVQEAMAWLRKHDIAALLINTDNKVMATSAIGSSLVHSNLMAI